MSNVSISTNSLTIGYGTHVVQSNLSFSLHAGEMVCMLGPNGCGKSTLLRTLAGLQPALSGTFSFPITDNRYPKPDTRYPLSNTTSNEFCPPVHRGTSEAEGVPTTDTRYPISAPPPSPIALVLTERLSLDDTTVHDVVAMGRYPYTSFLGGLSAHDEHIIAQALESVGLSNTQYPIPDTRYPISATPFNAHSDGEKQRILIAKAIAQETPIILLDEPTAHLDLPNRIRILQLLHRLAHEQSKTILISTHELDLAIQLSDRILLMSTDGIQLDTANQLRQTNAFNEAFGMDIFNPLQ